MDLSLNFPFVYEIIHTLYCMVVRFYIQHGLIFCIFIDNIKRVMLPSELNI